MRGSGGEGGNDAYQAQLAEVLGRWEAERAKTAELQGRAAAAAGLNDRVRSSAEAASFTQAELEEARGQLEAERRRGDAAEREMSALRLEVRRAGLVTMVMISCVRCWVCGLC